MAVFILEMNGDFSAYPSVEMAESAIESPDIESGEYIRAFDEQGNVLSIETLGAKHSDGLSLIPSSGVLKPTGENAAQELFSLLWSCLPVETSQEDTSLSTLVEKALEVTSRAGNGRYLPLLRGIARVEDLLGKKMLVGITYLDNARNFLYREQVFGIITAADYGDGITITLEGNRAGEDFSVPLDFRAMEPAEPGFYTLESSNESVSDPDYLARWTVTKPATKQ